MDSIDTPGVAPTRQRRGERRQTMATNLDTGRCQRCSARLRLEDLFCANCGAPVPEPAPRAAAGASRPGAARGERATSPWSEPEPWRDESSRVDPAWWEEPPSQRTPKRYSQGGFLPTSPDQAVSDTSRLWAAAAPLGIIAGAVFSAGLLSFIIPLIIWQVRKGSDDFASGHGREGFNAMLSLVVYSLVALVVVIPLTVVTLGVGLIALIGAAGVIGVVFLISLIIATIRALNSQPFRYPLMIRFFR